MLALLCSLRHMASEADQESNGFFLAFQVFSLGGPLKRLQAFHEASTAAKDAGNGSALALLCQGGLLFGASKLVRAVSEARRGPSDRTSIALEEAVSFMRLAVECAADGMFCHSLPCAELYVGIISLLGSVGAVDAGQQLAELQELLASPNEWAGGQVTHLLAGSALHGRRRAHLSSSLHGRRRVPSSATNQVATGLWHARAKCFTGRSCALRC